MAKIEQSSTPRRVVQKCVMEKYDERTESTNATTIDEMQTHARVKDREIATPKNRLKR